VSEHLRRYTTIVFGFEHVLRQVPAEAWDRPSPCEGWSVRQCAGHAMAVVNNVAARGGVGDNVDAFGDVGAFAGADPAETFRHVRNRFLAATDRAGALQTTITSSVGEMTLDHFIGLMCADTLVHTWDVGRGAGIDVELDPDAVAYVYADYQSRDQIGMRKPGRFDAAIDLGDDASELDRLIAFSGRDPR
jgi:uncharacterized protein (TIGR03086 family)